MHIDHAGIATADAAGLADLYTDLLDCSVAHEESFDGMTFLFLEFANGYFELIEPLEAQSEVAQYLDRNGPGIHHLAVATEDIEAAMEGARDCGVELLDEEPREGAWGHEIAFLYPQDTGGILLEFVHATGDH